MNLLQGFCHRAITDLVENTCCCYFKLDVGSSQLKLVIFQFSEKPVEKPGFRLTLLLVVSCFTGDPVRQPCLQHKVLSVSDAERQGGVSSGEAGAGGSDQRWDQVRDFFYESTADCWCLMSGVGDVWGNVTWCECGVVLQRGVRPAGLVPGDAGAAADQEGRPAEQQPAGPTRNGRRRHHHGCQVWAVSYRTQRAQSNDDNKRIGLSLTVMW